MSIHIRPRTTNPRHQLGVARSDPRQGHEGLEQGIENFGAHEPPFPTRMADRTAWKAYILPTPSPPVTGWGRGFVVRGQMN